MLAPGEDLGWRLGPPRPLCQGCESCRVAACSHANPSGMPLSQSACVQTTPPRVSQRFVWSTTTLPFSFSFSIHTSSTERELPYPYSKRWSDSSLPFAPAVQAKRASHESNPPHSSLEDTQTTTRYSEMWQDCQTVSKRPLHADCARRGETFRVFMRVKGSEADL